MLRILLSTGVFLGFMTAYPVGATSIEVNQGRISNL
jgi:hypothetical protein